MNLIGKIIGNRYEIIEQVGNGGMATVYRAKDRVLNRDVAVKVLKDEFTTDSDFIKRFNTEAQSAAALSAVNIVSIYDVGHEEENNLYYIVMELIKGKTLKEIIVKDGAISWKWAVNIAIQIADALEEAHSHGIVHRDIKPHNIIITEDGVAKVTDFGIAKAVSNSTMTAFGTTIGSVHYFSPEQAKGSITDAKSDLYSLGVVMYEMLTGKVPFDADTPVSVALKHMQEEAKEPIEENPDIPQAVNDIVVKAMKKDPSERYQSATEVLADLGKALKDPEGDFVIVENKDGEYTRVMNAVTDEQVKKSKKKKNRIAQYFEEHPKTKVLIFLLSLVLLFVIVFSVTKFVLDSGAPKKYQIPNLIDKTLEEATKTLKDLKLEIEVGDPEASSIIEEGKVVRQDPAYIDGKKLDEGSKVKVFLSKGAEENELPKFVGMKIEDAKIEASKIGIILKDNQENSDEVEEGYVIRQDTAEKTKVKSGEEVVVYVSSGKKKTTVPTVVGMDEGTAKATLSNRNLKAEIEYKTVEEGADGKVLEQSIEKDKEVPEGTTVKLTVSKLEKKEVKTYNVTISPSAIKSAYEQIKKDKKDTSNSINEITEPESSTISVTFSVGGREKSKEVSSEDQISKMDMTITDFKTTEKEIYPELNVNGKIVKYKKDLSMYDSDSTVTVSESDKI